VFRFGSTASPNLNQRSLAMSNDSALQQQKTQAELQKKKAMEVRKTKNKKNEKIFVFFHANTLTNCNLLTL